MSDQRWLSLTGICTVLQLTEPNVLWLAKKGFLVFTPGKLKTDIRYLDPTPEYTNKLRLCEAIYGRIHPLPSDFDLKTLLTRTEIAKIMGWTDATSKRFRHIRKLSGGVKVGSYTLYPVSVVRDLLWRQQGRKLSPQKAPFLIEELIRFFMAHQAKEAKLMPSDADFLTDDILQKKLARVMRMPASERAVAMREFWDKVEMAKQAADLLTGSASASSPA